MDGALTSRHAQPRRPLAWPSGTGVVPLLGLEPGGHHPTRLLPHGVDGALGVVLPAALALRPDCEKARQRLEAPGAVPP